MRRKGVRTVFATSGTYTTDITVDDLNGGTATPSGLPPGLSYNPTWRLISGTLTTAGTYLVTVVADDGHGGTDTESFPWYVLPRYTSMPIAVAGFGPDSAMQATAITLAHPATPVVGSVTLMNGWYPEADVEVTLGIWPEGRATLSQSTFTLRDNEYATFEVYPTSVSQEVRDTYLFAYAAGALTSTSTLTNVGIVLPQKVRGPDTPKGMKDRISIGESNWGTCNEVVRIAPNLKGLEDIYLVVTRPNGDNKYGNAEAYPADPDHLSVVTQRAVTVYGTLQTEPSYDANGEPDGANAGHLRLQAEITILNGALQLAMANGFAAANIPIGIRASNPVKLKGERSPAPGNPFFWGIRYEMRAGPDGDELKNVLIAETITNVKREGIFLDAPDLVGKPNPASQPIYDWVGPGVFNATTREEALNWLRDKVRAKGGYLKGEQKHRFLSEAMGGWEYVERSGFVNIVRVQKDPPAMWVEKKPQSFAPAPIAGLMADNARGEKPVPFI